MSLRDAISVLLIDDDPAYVELIRQTLADVKGQQFVITHVARLADALRAIDASRARVVLLDVHLPDGNGLQWLQAHRDRLHAAVIVVTGDPDSSLAEELAPGAQDFLFKGETDPRQLVRAIRYADERRRVEDQLARSREYFQSLIENARDLITVVDDRGVILYQSPSSDATLGLAPAAVAGRYLSDFIAPADVPRARALLTMAFEEGGAAGEFEVFHANGSVRALDVVISRIPPEGERLRAVLNSRDITERRQAVEALRVREEQLRQAQKMEAVGRLAGGIAHDFSNVLTVITAASERIQDRATAPDVAGDVDIILRNADRAASLTRQLLAFSRQQTLAPRPLDLVQLVKRAGRLLKRFIGEHIELALELPDKVLAVEADPVQLEQVLMNLAINARDAMPDGGRLSITVRRMEVDEEFARRHPPMRAGEYVLLEVVDTGQGMSEETQARAFEPFFTTKLPGHGTGLGLSTVYGIIKQSGGFIWLTSRVGEGTEFWIFLPPTSAKPMKAPAAKAAGRAKASTILLAEDEDEVRALLRDLLESHGHTVLEANGVAQGLEVSNRFDGRIDLLLTDVVMPGGTGRDLAREIVARRPGIKVLYMSGYPEVGGGPAKWVLEPGVPFLSKPFTRDALVAKLHELLG